MLTSVTGINWGDEGKGRIVDLLTEKADYVVRYQGGNNAGHTVVTDQGKFVLNLLPSGILHPTAVCVLGNGMVIDPDHLRHEIAMMQYMKVKVDASNLKISDKATLRRSGFPRRVLHSDPPGGASPTPTGINI